MFNLQSTDNIQTLEDQGQVVPLRNIQTDQPLLDDHQQPVTITVAGTYSSIYRKALAAQKSQVFRYLRRHRGNGGIDGATHDKNQRELVASCILAWSDMTWDGAPFPCTRENTIRLLEAYPWIQDQLEEAMGDHEGFSRSSSAS